MTNQPQSSSHRHHDQSTGSPDERSSTRTHTGSREWPGRRPHVPNAFPVSETAVSQADGEA